MGLARNLSKFKPTSDGLVGAEDISEGAVTAEKIAEGAIPAGSGTNTFTASGSITAGKAVALIGNGIVEQPSGVYFSRQPSNSVSGSTYNGEFVFGSTHSVSIQRRTGSPSVAYVVVKNNATGQVWTNSTLWVVDYVNDSYNLDGSSVETFFVDYNSEYNKFIIIYTFPTSASQITLRAKSFSVGDNSVTFDSATVIDTHNRVGTEYTYPSALRATRMGNTNKWALAYSIVEYQAQYNRGKIFAIEFTGSSFTSGSVYQPFSAGTNVGGLNSNMFYHSAANKFFISMYNGSAYRYVVFSVSGVAITGLATSQTPSGSLTGDKRGHNGLINGYVIGNVSVSESNLVCSGFSFTENTVNNTTFNLSNSLVAGAAYLSYAVKDNKISFVFTSSGSDRYLEYKYDGGFLLSVSSNLIPVTSYDKYTSTSDAGFGYTYRAGSASNYTEIYGNGTAATTSNVGAFIGIATQSVTNGQSVSVTTLGGTNANQSGLSFGQRYYALSNGDIATSGAVEVGKAINSTTILVGG